MKKIFFIITLATAAFAGCTKQETDIPTAEDVKYNAVITADIPQTKVAVDDAYTKLSWNNGDRISVLTSNGVFKDFVYSGADGAASAEFKGTLENGEEVAGYAIYPAHADHAKATDGSLSVYLPAEHVWKESEVKGPMVATISGGTASFAHAGGLFAFDVTGMPAGAKGFRFETEGLSVNGSFAYGTDQKLKAVEGEKTSVVMTFDALTEAQQMRFHIPVPTGSYEGFTISYINAEGMSVEIKSATATNVIDAATVKCFTVGVAEGDAWYVTATGTASADGLSWANATTLSNALAKAQNGDVIFVGAGTYVPDTFISGQVADADDNVTADEVITATGDAQKAFIVNKNVTILGGFPAEGGNTADPETNATVLSGNDVTNHVVLVSVAEQGDGKVKMSGFTVSGAASDADDSGKWSINGTLLDDYSGSMAVVGTGTTLDLENMTFTGNNTVNASAVYCSDATVNIRNCVFTENKASGNGTVWFSDGSVLNFSDSEISKNEANNAAGLYLQLFDGAQMTANVSNVTISSNEATAKGGGMWLRAETAGQNLNAVIDGCTITENKSATGASIRIENASGMTISSCVLTENEGTGTSEGGAFHSLDASNTFTDCSFASNTAQGNGTFLIQSNAVATLNTFDGCEWTDNTTTKFANMYVYGKATDNNVVITNSLFKGNSVTGRGGALYVRATNANGKVDCKCVNTTFYDNKATSQGTAIVSYSNNDSFITNVDLISCTITNNSTTAAAYAVTAEGSISGDVQKGAPTVNLYNSLIVNNKGVHATNGTSDTYNVGKVQKGAITRYNCQNGITYYGADGKNAGANVFDYATMLGALNTDGVCPLLLPDNNPAVTGGMTSTELSALASTNVPAAVLTKDQLGNDRTGNVIGAYVGGLTQSQGAL